MHAFKIRHKFLCGNLIKFSGHIVCVCATDNECNFMSVWRWRFLAISSIVLLIWRKDGQGIPPSSVSLHFIGMNRMSDDNDEDCNSAANIKMYRNAAATRAHQFKRVLNLINTRKYKNT